MGSEKKNVIYIITNPMFPEDCVKIGFSNDVEKRIKTFNTGAPQDYEIFATYEVPDIKDHKADKVLHHLLLKLDPNLKFDAKKEFFHLYPEEAYDILMSLAIIHGREDKLELRGILKNRGKTSKTVSSGGSAALKGKVYKSINGLATLLSKGDGSYVLLSGSEIKLTENFVLNNDISQNQQDLISSGFISKQTDGRYLTTVDMNYNSPSAVAALVYGNRRNGWTSWKNSDGKTLDEAERKSS